MRRLALALSLTLIMLLAGCGGLLTAGEGPPDGLSTSDIEDGYRVAGTHQSALEGSPFRIEIHQEIVDAETGTPYFERQARATWGANRSRFQMDIATSGDPPEAPAIDGSVTYYSNGSIAVYYRESPDAETAVGVVSGQDDQPMSVSEVAGNWPYGPPSASQLLGPRFQAAAPGNVIRTEAGFRVESEELSVSRISVGKLQIENISEASFTAFLTPRGDIRDYELTATGELSGTTVEVRETMTVSETGTATVEEPEWFEQAVSGSGVGK